MYDLKKAIVKKNVKSKVAAKKWLDGRLKTKNLVTIIQVNLVPNPSEMWRRQHKFAINLPSSHFLAAILDFASFFTTDCTIFLQLDYIFDAF